MLNIAGLQAPGTKGNAMTESPGGGKVKPGVIGGVSTVVVVLVIGAVVAVVIQKRRQRFVA